MRLLGIDFGSKRVGIALSDESGRFAFPHSVILNDQNLLSRAQAIIEKEAVEKIVIGESRDFKGNANKILPASERFAEQLREATGLPVEFEKEFLTTAEASRIQGEHSGIDASAAALILKSYIDKHP